MRAVVSQVHDLLAAQPRRSRSLPKWATVRYGGPGGFTSSAGVTKGTVCDPEAHAIRASARSGPDTAVCEDSSARLTFDNAEFGSAGINVILTSETGEGLEAAGLALQQQMRCPASSIRAPPRHRAAPKSSCGPKPMSRTLGVSVATTRPRLAPRWVTSRECVS
jgi:hypothetical protein